MWHRHRDGGSLGLTKAERPIFYGTYARHEEKESSAREADMWLSTYRPAMVPSKARVAEQRQALRRHSKAGEAAALGEGHSSAGSGGGGEPAEPAIAGPAAGLRGATHDSSP